MNAITEFLLARITEDEVRATLRDWHQSDCPIIPGESGYAYPCDCGVPERMMAECAAKRAITRAHTTITVWPDGTDGMKYYVGGKQACASCDERTQAPCPTARTLAAVYSDHPDYNPDWAL